MAEDVQQKFVLFISNDLMFASKIKHASSSCNMDFRSANGVEKVQQLFESATGPVAVAIADLVAVGSDIDKLASLAQVHHVPMLAYSPHVQTDLIAKAESAGCAKVLTRGQLNRDAASILLEFA